jgi:hypothetical protein
MLNMNFEQSVVFDTHQQPWLASLHASAWRKPLARENAERGQPFYISK